MHSVLYSYQWIFLPSDIRWPAAVPRDSEPQNSSKAVSALELVKLPLAYLVTISFLISTLDTPS